MEKDQGPSRSGIFKFSLWRVVLRRPGLILIPATASLILFSLATFYSVESLPSLPGLDPSTRVQFFDRVGLPLVSRNARGVIEEGSVTLNEVPPFLLKAIIAAEDRRFYERSGPDIQAVAAAIWQNIRARRIVRGASGISEQSVRILHPRKRTLWSRWLELVEACRLESNESKDSILQFYLNNVPYPHGHHGVKEAALDLFDRDLAFLSKREMLALAVVIRAPVRLDPLRLKKNGRLDDLNSRIDRLAEFLRTSAAISEEELNQIKDEELVVSTGYKSVNIGSFARLLRANNFSPGKHATTLDLQLQDKVQRLVDNRVRDLHARNVSNAAALVVDNGTGGIRAWVNARAFLEGRDIDAVRALRQPGSTLKPFLYATALEKGWTPATIIKDQPLSRSIGSGLKGYRNYSGAYYGDVRLREALGNSLNIPAIHAIEYVGVEDFYTRLKSIGFESLNKSPEFYGQGLALGDGEVSLFELVRAYLTLAREGERRDLIVSPEVHQEDSESSRIFSKDVASLIGHILSDPQARRLEFGSSGLLSFPLQTAIKTGTSSDYRDAWAIAYSSQFTVGVWMGNLNAVPMDEITGSTGPLMVVRAIFKELAGQGKQLPLWISPHLKRVRVCERTGLPEDDCPAIEELFVPGTEPVEATARSSAKLLPGKPKIELPSPGLRLAIDPRISENLQQFPFTLSSPGRIPQTIDWIVNGARVGSSKQGDLKFLWPIKRGSYEVSALIKFSSQESVSTEKVRFVVR